MKRYHITVLGYYNNSDSTYQTTINCSGMDYSSAGLYEFYNKDADVGSVVVAYYPIRQTIITKIEIIK